MAFSRNVTSQSEFLRLVEGGCVEGVVLESFSANLRGTNVQFRDCVFRDVMLVHARLHSCTFANCQFFGCSFRGSFWSRCTLNGCRFQDSVFDNAHFDAQCEFFQSKPCELNDCSMANARMHLRDPLQVRFANVKPELYNGCQITGHEFFEHFFPAYTCDKVCRNGKQGTVYLGHRVADEFGVAIKVLDQHFSNTGTATRHRFNSREVANLRLLRSKHVPKLLDYDLSETGYLIMERAPGLTLHDWLRQDVLFNGALGRSLMRDSFEALAAVQKNEIVHQDIAPKNISVHIRHQDARVWLLDFGLSKLVGAPHSRIVGTMMTMAPEVHENAKPSFASDVFSMGVTVSWALTGRNPFGDENVTERRRLRRIRGGESDMAGINAALRSILTRCVDSDANARYASAEDVLNDLAAA